MSGHPKRTGLILAAIAVVAVVALVLPALRDRPVRAYALGVPDATEVSLLHAGQQACEGPIESAYRFRAVGLWVSSRIDAVPFDVTVQTVGHQVLASGSSIAAPSQTEPEVRLSNAIPAGRRVMVCVRGRIGLVALRGDLGVRPGLTVTGVKPGTQFALVLKTSASDGSLLHWLPAAFTRASLWRPSWVGSWTFWMLAIGVFAMFGVGVGAVLRAAADDESEPVTPGGDGPDDGGGEPDGSETREDRAQAVA